MLNISKFKERNFYRKEFVKYNAHVKKYNEENINDKKNQ